MLNKEEAYLRAFFQLNFLILHILPLWRILVSRGIFQDFFSQELVGKIRASIQRHLAHYTPSPVLLMAE
jgi:hypothetical protein